MEDPDPDSWPGGSPFSPAVESPFGGGLPAQALLPARAPSIVDPSAAPALPANGLGIIAAGARVAAVLGSDVSCPHSVTCIAWSSGCFRPVLAFPAASRQCNAQCMAAVE